LLVELDDAERVTTIETEAEANLTLGEFVGAVRDVIRRQDILASESDTRAWIVARDTGRAGAEALGVAINEALRTRRPWRGAALMASVGVAVPGEDGATVGDLIDAAEQARFAAAAKGISVVRAVPDDRPQSTQ
jgi:GGDEF domain-containing protein